METLKKIILWKYERASWQWDVLCLLILAFIFLTPKSWFDRKEALQPETEKRASKSMNFRPTENVTKAIINKTGKF